MIAHERCSRSSCRADLWRHYATHLLTRQKYCIRCARRINRANKYFYPDGLVVVDIHEAAPYGVF